MNNVIQFRPRPKRRETTTQECQDLAEAMIWLYLTQSIAFWTWPVVMLGAWND